MNFADLLLRKGEPGRPALLELAGTRSHAEVANAADAVAGFLLRRGARKGDCVGIAGENSLFWVAAYLGAMRAGCVAVPLSSALSSADLHSTAEATRMRFLFGEVELDGVLRVAPGAIPLAGQGEPPRRPAVQGDDLAALLFSSGSTGRPRGVMISHGNLFANTNSIIAAIGLKPIDRVMAVLPFHYCFGASLLHTHLALGASLVIDGRFMFPDKVLQRMIDTQCSGFAGVPSHYQILMRRSRFKTMQFPALRWMQQAGGKLPEPAVRELRAAAPGVKLFVMYGATEATARISVLPDDQVDRRPSSVGKPIPGVTVRLLDETGAPVRPGDVGEVVVEGDNVARGYFGDLEESASTFRDGRLHTGDLATMDEEGFLYIVGRAKGFLKCGGTRTSAERVEEALLGFTDIVEAAVIGVPDEILGEAVAAFVVAREAADTTVEARLRDYAKGTLPPVLQPRRIEVVGALPRTPAGKIQRHALRARVS